MLVYLMPQAVPLAVPVGATFGLRFGFPRGVGRRLRRAAGWLLIVSTATSFAVMAWVRPAANQGFRVLIFHALHQSDEVFVREPAKGFPEMSLSELRNEMSSRRNSERSARAAAIMFHQIWAVPVATGALGLFALSVVTRWRLTYLWSSVVAVGMCCAYFSLLMVARQIALHGDVAASTAAWLPDLLFVIAAAAVFLRNNHDREDPVLNESSSS
jgi:lipopolysaccharide export LptBFGC system permease protein LptF